VRGAFERGLIAPSADARVLSEAVAALVPRFLEKPAADGAMAVLVSRAPALACARGGGTHGWLRARSGLEQAPPPAVVVQQPLPPAAPVAAPLAAPLPSSPARVTVEVCVQTHAKSWPSRQLSVDPAVSLLEILELAADINACVSVQVCGVECSPSAALGATLPFRNWLHQRARSRGAQPAVRAPDAHSPSASLSSASSPASEDLPQGAVAAVAAATGVLTVNFVVSDAVKSCTCIGCEHLLLKKASRRACNSCHQFGLRISMDRVLFVPAHSRRVEQALNNLELWLFAAAPAAASASAAASKGSREEKDEGPDEFDAWPASYYVVFAQSSDAFEAWSAVPDEALLVDMRERECSLRMISHFWKLEVRAPAAALKAEEERGLSLSRTAARKLSAPAHGAGARPALAPRPSGASPADASVLQLMFNALCEGVAPRRVPDPGHYTKVGSKNKVKGRYRPQRLPVDGSPAHGSSLTSDSPHGHAGEDAASRAALAASVGAGSTAPQVTPRSRKRVAPGEEHNAPLLLPPTPAPAPAPAPPPLLSQPQQHLSAPMLPQASVPADGLVDPNGGVFAFVDATAGSRDNMVRVSWDAYQSMRVGHCAVRAQLSVPQVNNLARQSEESGIYDVLLVLRDLRSDNVRLPPVAAATAAETADDAATRVKRHRLAAGSLASAAAVPLSPPPPPAPAATAVAANGRSFTGADGLAEEKEASVSPALLPPSPLHEDVQGSAASSRWTCSGCSCENLVADTNCRMCSLPRPASLRSALEAASTGSHRELLRLARMEDEHFATVDQASGQFAEQQVGAWEFGPVQQPNDPRARLSPQQVPASAPRGAAVAGEELRRVNSHSVADSEKSLEGVPPKDARLRAVAAAPGGGVAGIVISPVAAAAWAARKKRSGEEVEGEAPVEEPFSDKWLRVVHSALFNPAGVLLAVVFAALSALVLAAAISIAADPLRGEDHPLNLLRTRVYAPAELPPEQQPPPPPPLLPSPLLLDSLNSSLSAVGSVSEPFRAWAAQNRDSLSALGAAAEQRLATGCRESADLAAATGSFYARVGADPQQYWMRRSPAFLASALTLCLRYGGEVGAAHVRSLCQEEPGFGLLLARRCRSRCAGLSMIGVDATSLNASATEAALGDGVDAVVRGACTPGDVCFALAAHLLNSEFGDPQSGGPLILTSQAITIVEAASGPTPRPVTVGQTAKNTAFEMIVLGRQLEAEARVVRGMCALASNSHRAAAADLQAREEARSGVPDRRYAVNGMLLSVVSVGSMGLTIAVLAALYAIGVVITAACRKARSA
jgi:hypothetical protein